MPSTSAERSLCAMTGAGEVGLIRNQIDGYPQRARDPRCHCAGTENATRSSRQGKVL